MPFIVSAAIAPSKQYALTNAEGDVQWIASRDKATRFTEPEADSFVADFRRYSEIDLEVEGTKA